MKKSAYIDYNSNVKITFEIKEGKYETFYTCQIESPLKHRLEKNLKKITRIIKGKLITEEEKKMIFMLIQDFV